MEEINTIKEMGYEVKKFTPWHFRIKKADSDIALDIFPTTRVFVVNRGTNREFSKPYENLIELVEDKLDTFSKNKLE